jgi:serine/threonine protein kinase/WD40 repeat protein
MGATGADVKSIFGQALALSAPEERAAYLQRACAGDPELRAEVESLLQADQDAASFLGPRKPGPVATIDQPVREGPGTVLGPYQLLEQLGEGGFGVVFLAEQTQPVRRRVALKVLKPGMDTRQVVARFEQERQALAIMDHPNIARVLDGGATPAGRPYFVMELVKGVPITEFCDQHRLAPRQRLELFVTVCQAVQYAHHKGIIHRDLKPSNVLVGMHDTTPVPKVIDFGVAKAHGQELTDKTLFTGLAQMIGTPLYMAPEQAGLSGLGVDTRCDVYSLGVLLYELLTGTTPFDTERFRKAGYDEIRRIIREEEPPKPSTRLTTLGQAATTAAAYRKSDSKRLSRLCRGELDWIVMKALEKDRNRRYESAGALAADVQRFLKGEPVAACPPSRWYRFRKSARRHWRALLAAALLATAVLVTVVGLSVSAAWIAHRERDTQKALLGEGQANKALEETRERERRGHWQHRLDVARRELQAGNHEPANNYLRECPDDLRDRGWRHLHRLCHAEVLTLRDQHGYLICLTYSSDSRLLAAAGLEEIRIWDAGTGRLRLTIPVRALPLGLAFQPGDKQLTLLCCSPSRIQDFVGPINDLPLLAGKRQVANLARGTYLPLEVKTWDVRDLNSGSCKLVFSSKCPAAPPLEATLSANGMRVALAQDRELLVWDPTTARTVSFPGPHAARITGIAWSGEDRHLASLDREGIVKLWNAQTGALVRTLQTGAVNPSLISHEQLALAPNCGWVAFERYDREADKGEVCVWDARTGCRLHVFEEHKQGMSCIAACVDSRQLVTTNPAGTITVWDMTAAQAFLTFANRKGDIRVLAVSPDGRRLAATGLEKVVRLWDVSPVD